MAGPFEPQLVDVDPELLADIVQQSVFAAVAAAFRLAARNGLITLAPRESWPERIDLDAGREGS